MSVPRTKVSHLHDSFFSTLPWTAGLVFSSCSLFLENPTLLTCAMRPWINFLRAKRDMMEVRAHTQCRQAPLLGPVTWEAWWARGEGGSDTARFHWLCVHRSWEGAGQRMYLVTTSLTRASIFLLHQERIFGTEGVRWMEPYELKPFYLVIWEALHCFLVYFVQFLGRAKSSDAIEWPSPPLPVSLVFDVWVHSHSPGWPWIWGSPPTSGFWVQGIQSQPLQTRAI